MPIYVTYKSGNIWSSVWIHFPFMFIKPINWQSIMCINMTAVTQWANRLYCYIYIALPTKPLSLAWHNMVNNQTPCVIMKVIDDYDYIYDVIDYNYLASGNGDYLKSCNRLPITPTLYYTWQRTHDNED